MDDHKIITNLRRILREDIVSQAETSVYKSLEPLGNLGGGKLKEDETDNVDNGVLRLPFPRIVELVPKNPKKAFMLYNEVYKTLKEGSPTPDEVKKMWSKYSSSKNIIMFVRKIAKIISTYYGNNTTELLK